MSEAVQNNTGASLAEGGSALAPVVEVAFWLFIVVMVILAGAWLLRRFGGAAFQGGGVIRVIAAVSLGGRDRLTLVQVGEQQILLGVSPGRVNTLHVFDEPVVDVSTRSGSSGTGADTTFARKLHNYMNRGPQS